MGRPVACLAGVALLLSGSVGGGAAGDAGARHLIYLHGRIVQDQQDPRPRHPRFGFYELEKIEEAFRARGFAVSAEIRPRSISVSDAADRVVGQVRRLLESGVAADRITVVGASMGAAIALRTSARLQEPEVRFCVLGACLYETVRQLLGEEGKGPRGRLLSIREASDESSEPCPAWKDDLGLAAPLHPRELVLHTGLSHGFLYRPLPEWVDPVAEWARAGPRDGDRP
jgi:pimeloyl-ACP methyl ester carboxylesterase